MASTLRASQPSELPASLASDHSGLNSAVSSAAAARDRQPSLTPVVPVKRGPGRPKGSGKKPRIEQESDHLQPKIKRPVGRPRKDGRPAGSLLPPKEKRPTGRPRKSQTTNAVGSPTSLAQSISLEQPDSGWEPITSFEENVSRFGANSSDTTDHGAMGRKWQAQMVTTAGVRGVIGSISTSSAPDAIQTLADNTRIIERNLNKDDWQNILQTDPDGFLHLLLSALSVLPVRSLGVGPSVHSAFHSHLVSLAQRDTKQQPRTHPEIPSLYYIMKTFWLPSSPAYFSLAASASTSRVPSEHRFLYWDPLPLVFNGISCPNCTAPLMNRGRIKSGPIMIYDLGRPFYIIGCEYVCLNVSCTVKTDKSNAQEEVKFASTDARILRALPTPLRDEFPARLIMNLSVSSTREDDDLGPDAEVWNWQPLGVSNTLWNMVRGCLNVGMSKDAIVRVINGICDGNTDESKSPNMTKEDDKASRSSLTGDIKTISETVQHPSNGTNATSTSLKEVASGAYYNAWRANTAASTPRMAAATTSPAVTSSIIPSPSGPTLSAGVITTTTLSPGNVSIMSTPQQYSYHATKGVSQLGYSYGMYNTHSTSMSSIGQTNVITPYESDPNVLKRVILSSPVNSFSTTSSTSISTESAIKRVRHCSKCGSQDCKGKGGRTHCPNPCQDCGRLSCAGRNSKRPDKRCEEAWP